MGTPTNHTSSSFFRYLGLDPDDTPSASLDENSSIEESNIFADFSAHSRWKSPNTAIGASTPVAQGRIKAPSGGQSLGPLLEERDAPATIVPSSSVRSARQDPVENQSSGDPEETAPALPQAPPPPPQPSLHKQLKTNTKQQLHEHDATTGAASTLTSGSKELKSVLKRPTIACGDGEDPNNSNTARTNATFATPVVCDPSNTTNKTFGFLPSNIPSETVHTSNMTVAPRGRVGDGGIFSMLCSTDDFDRVAAWAIHVALILFCGLVVAAVILSFIVIRNYGLIALVGLILMVTFVAFLACFVDETILSKNPKLKPIRQKISNVVQATRNLFVEEYQLFLIDYNEHMLLLTNGEGIVGTAGESLNSSDGNNHVLLNADDPKLLPAQASLSGIRRRSKVFRVVKPLLVMKKKLFSGSRGGARKKESSLQPSHHRASASLPVEYHPPTVSENSIVVV